MTRMRGVTRQDGSDKVTGAALYAADYNADDQLYAVLVGATITAGRVSGYDVAEARRDPGVVHVLTELPAVDQAFVTLPSPPLATRFLPMQGNVVHYWGQPVAMVLAESLEVAEGAASRVRVHYEREPFINPDTAVAVPPSPESGYGMLDALEFRKGDAAGALAEARVRVRGTYTQPSRHGNPMEPSAIVAEWHDGRLTVHDSVQHVYAVRDTLAAALGMTADKVRVVSPHTGGGFGTKAFVWPHEILAAMAAKAVGRPVKLVLTRQDMYSIVGYQPLLEHRVSLGADERGELRAIVHEADNITAVTDDYVEFGTGPSKALYASPNISTSQRVRRGHVNLSSFMRSPIDGPGTWALGSAMDELARTLSMDPLALRLVNYAETHPADGTPWSSKKLREAYEEGARRFGWWERPEGGTRDGHWLIGCGMADCTQGQFRFTSQARVRLRADGTAQVEAGYTDIGAGSTTIFPQIAAETLGIDIRSVKGVSGDTDLPYAGPTYGSGTTLAMGTAVHLAANAVLRRLAGLLSWPAEEVRADSGALAWGDQRRSYADILRAAHLDEVVGDGEMALPGGAFADAGAPGVASRTFGAMFVEVGVDPDLGLLRLRRATGVYSVGAVVNERTARSQMIGGLVWGWGMAAMEASHYDPQLGHWLSQDLAGVALPVNADIPPHIDMSFVDEFDPYAGPLGAKGIGELSATGIAAAVANAVFDATGRRVRDLPITPEKLLDPRM
ncbi:xanthine dehydrogenase family protein molybdopterin-binding subunit [Streptomyces sp. Ag109_O5-10]|uniref:xanthine dehydrogenase family protein molybdopterin-binding subunit n=1 Tax=Streptomyces sp. Ag109_O5-10 TaxID=1855349 RepID=UPI000899655B|nr:xanthine dehydrogenase family protein molybdopterin-binding subunit [Streptomyces sp. Ag109_O5-10]SEF15987.1 xanthine dehydrogenase YagR molybdenum-binding subunit [Streptomyces sp. Ag109_O5-10]